MCVWQVLCGEEKDASGEPLTVGSVAGGGRYDGLIARLSAGDVETSGIGAAIRADRLGRGGGR